MKRLFNAFKVAYYVWKEPLAFVNYESTLKLFDLIVKVAEENKPYMTHLAQITPEGEKEDLVTVWAGSGIGAEPLERIEILAKENNLLKKELRELRRKAE